MELMANTRMTDDWIKRAVAGNPCVRLESGNYRTCPVRLSFPHILHMSEPKKADIKPAYGANLLFAAGADLSVLQQAVLDVLKEKCPKALSDNPREKVKVKLPFLDQGDMLRYDGYLEGSKYIIATSKKYKPACIDLKQNAITDETRIYAGVWAICTVNPFWYDVDVNKGVSFGLQSVMIIADDEQIGGGGGENLADAFSGINIEAGDVEAGDVDADALFGAEKKGASSSKFDEMFG
ncbi:ssDNA-binding protein [Sphingomonas sp.]|uniref:ssDNA-binding protein n=1 Tax=Sphingomonas sp. TaxID=28214 RepID=UPI002580EEC9|nr:ssDNA-binding protein [Sphingomonas sp.]